MFWKIEKKIKSNRWSRNFYSMKILDIVIRRRIEKSRRKKGKGERRRMEFRVASGSSRRVERQRNLCDRSRNLSTSSFTSSKRFQKQRSFFPRGIYEVAVVEARANKVTRGPLWSASLQFLASPRRFLLSPPPSLSLFLPPKINAPRKTRTGWHVAENTTAPRPLPVRFLTKAMILGRGDPLWNSGEGGGKK